MVLVTFPHIQEWFSYNRSFFRPAVQKIIGGLEIRRLKRWLLILSGASSFFAWLWFFVLDESKKRNVTYHGLKDYMDDRINTGIFF